MQKADLKIEPYRDEFRNQIISTWEKSVRATHDFVKPADIEYFKEMVEKIDFSSFPVYCLTNNDAVIGFIGVAEFKIETLFLDPDLIGKGLGKKLMDFALTKLKATMVDVNEENLNAVQFYSKFGFQVYDRIEEDPEGKDYPILKMKLQDANKLPG